jgi:hypothetical protein
VSESLQSAARSSIEKHDILRFVNIVLTMKNLTIPLDRAHRVLFGTGMEPQKQLSRRIDEGITQIGCQLHLRIIKRNEDLGRSTNASSKIPKRSERFL